MSIYVDEFDVDGLLVVLKKKGKQTNFIFLKWISMCRVHLNMSSKTCNWDGVKFGCSA